ncbi:MAG: hypothetical protein ACOY4L_05315 [Pseudomonadota bacterium]
MIFPLPASQEGPRELALRLWKSGVVLDSDGNQRWIGTVSFKKPGRFALLMIPVGDQRYEAAQAALAHALTATGVQLAQRVHRKHEISTAWTGNVLLIRNP